MRIRDATSADIPAILAIYNDVVSSTTAIYDERPSTLRGAAGLVRRPPRQEFPCVGWGVEWRSDGVFHLR